MRHEIRIDYPSAMMEKSGRRMTARNDFRYVDRVPVNYCIVPRFFAHQFGLRYIDFFRDSATQYRWLLEFAKYQIEHIPSDFCQEPVLYVHPYFDNAVPPSGQGAEVGWTENSPLRAIPVIHTVEEMDRFEVAAPDANLRGRVIEWWLEMREYAAETKVIFGDVEGRVEMSALTTGGLSPHMLAIDLVGPDFYWWMVEYPEQCHRFLQKITQGEIEAEKLTRRVDPRSRGNFYGLAEDSAQIMSPELVREFCLPYTATLFEEFGKGLRFGRGIHMCGNSCHLLSLLRDEYRMTHFDLFGYLVPPEVAADELGSSSLLWGNIDPMLMLRGTPAEVGEAATKCLAALAPTGALMLGDGANVCPGTPLASFKAVMDAAQQYAESNSATFAESR